MECIDYATCPRCGKLESRKLVEKGLCQTHIRLQKQRRWNYVRSETEELQTTALLIHLATILAVLCVYKDFLADREMGEFFSTSVTAILITASVWIQFKQIPIAKANARIEYNEKLSALTCEYT